MSETFWAHAMRPYIISTFKSGYGINYRTTEEIRQWATTVLAGATFDDLDGQADDLKGYRSLLSGEEPRIQGFTTLEEEVDFIVKQLQGFEETQPLEGICIVVRKNQLVERYAHALRQQGIPTQQIRRSLPDDQTKQGVRIATMHRVKGLQFDGVFLASVNKEVIPLAEALNNAADEAALENALNIERSLLHVAATRAKRYLWVSYFGDPSPFVSTLILKV
jgi:superfamily I DNA/RNA helicase